MNTRQFKRPAGVTLVEVIFAIGVVLIGLVGLISVLPVAGRRAQDAIGLNVGGPVAVEAFERLNSYDLLQRPAWVAVNDAGAYLTALASAPAFASFDSFCIDPLFVSDSYGRVSETATPSGYYRQYELPTSLNPTNGHRRRLFPYYKQEFNPLTDPSENVTTSNAWSLWSATQHTRMLRVGLLGTTALLSSAESTLVGENPEAFAYGKTKDRTLNATPQVSQAVDAGVAYGKKTTDGTYTWFATVNRLRGTDYASVAIVVVRNRDRLYETRKNIDGVASNPGDNATSERLAYVAAATGFSGGAGGNLRIVMTDTVSKELSPGDWIMFSRFNPAIASAIHRWYRVAGVMDKPEKVTFTDPVTNVDRDVLQYKLIVDGPDWSFGFTTPGMADTTVGNNTFVTLVDGVVSVHEHVVRVGSNF